MSMIDIFVVDIVLNMWFVIFIMFFIFGLEMLIMVRLFRVVMFLIVSLFLLVFWLIKVFVFCGLKLFLIR